MPTASKRRRIIDAILAVLRGMTDESVYHYPVTTPEAVTADPAVNPLTEDNVDLPFYKVEPTPEGRREFFPAMQLVENFRLNIMARYDADTSDPLSRMVVWENLAADLEVALAVDITLGGLAYDVRVLEPQPVIVVGSATVVLMQPIEVRYHRTYGVPA